jgi:AcrR family transcriptional regulator
MRVLPGQASRLPPGPIPTSRDQLAADQRRRILEAAADLVAKRGYHGTTIELIIRRAKVGYATFYKNFSDKEECLIGIFDEAGAELQPMLRDAFVAQEGPWDEKVAATLQALFEAIASHPNVARVCLVEALTAGPVAVARYEEALKRFEPLLLPGRELKKSNADLPDTLEATLFGGVFWIAYQRLIVGEADKLLELLPETIELVLSPYVGEDEAVRVADEFGARLAGRA